MDEVDEGRWLWRLPQGRFLAVFWGSMLAVDLLRAVGASPGASTVAVAVVVAGCCWGQSAKVTAAAAGIGWLFVTGFVVHAGGALAPIGVGDVGRLAALLGLACLTSAAGTVVGRLVRQVAVRVAGREPDASSTECGSADDVAGPGVPTSVPTDDRDATTAGTR
jgi:hypothetical protein